MKMTKKLIVAMLAAVLVLTAAACGGNNSSSTASKESEASVQSETSTESASSAASGDTAESGAVAKVKEAGKVVMVTNAEFPPFEFKEGDSIVGIDAEISQKIAEKLGVTLEITDIAFNSVVPSVQSGKADFGASGMSITEERLKNVDFTDPYFTSSQVIIVGVDSEYTGRNDLSGKIVGVQSGTTGDSYCSNEDGKSDVQVGEVKRYNKGMDAVADLIAGRLDAVVIDKDTANALAEQSSGKVKVLDEAMTEEQYAICVAKGSDLVETINEVLAEMKENGELEALFEKYEVE